MSAKKRPILSVLVILGCVALLLCSTMIIIFNVLGSSSPLSFHDKIGVIQIDGTISSSRAITSKLVKFRKDNKIKAIILRINSPGGSVGPSQEIYREVRRTIKTKKVIASLGCVAASGGYYVASAADRIVADPGTITGSIGVIMQFIRIEDLLGKMGVDFEILKSGEFKDIGSPARKLTERDKEILNRLIDDIQTQFVEAVARGRNLSIEKVSEIADGRVFSGARAKELGLVDVIGNFEDAVEITKEMAGLEGEVHLVYPKKSKLELWERFIETSGKAVIRLLQGMKPVLEYRWSGFLAHV